MRWSSQDDGIDTAAFSALLSGQDAAPVKPKLAHIIPNFQNPAGYTLSETKRRELVALASHARLHDLRG